MSKILCFYYPDFADFEITLACHKLRQVGKREIVGVADALAPVTSESGLRYLPDATLAQAMDFTDVDALLIPGGPVQPAPDAMLTLIRSLHARGVLIAAICNGPHYLARAGLLDTHRYTTTCSIQAAARLATPDPFPRANYLEAERVVRDGQLITAKGRAFVDFSMALFDALGIYADPRDAQTLWQDIRG
ncbi:DJ-1/PfpI family protein [Uliginosibacterium sp. H1]|uniref:DJ-1/PfpI family protein n=1 Tax=Uliginosibacterium sp. H1 TaxID=3114757 RepID=UPI002E178036|nr:DJ-1/PfpI family protein [Uliginosibacterium sp. H1]